MRETRRQRGFTLLEVVIMAVVGSLIMLMMARFFGKTAPFFRRIAVRQQVQLQSRAAMDTMIKALRNGKAGTLVISTPAFTPMAPYSRVDFELATRLTSGTSSYAIYLSSRTIYLKEFGPPPPANRVPRALASNVSGLKFTGDSRDPAIVNVSLRIEARWDQTRDPVHVTSIFIPNQMAHMVETP